MWLEGEFDLGTNWSLGAALAGAASGHHADVMLDLSGVSFMDAGTVGVIVDHEGVLAAQGRVLSIRHPSRPARMVLDACALSRLVNLPVA